MLLVLFTCPLSSCSNKNDGPRGRFNCISTVSCKGSVCVEVLTIFYGMFFVEEGQFIKYTPSALSLHFSSHFFHLLTPPRFGALNLPHGPHSSKNNFFGIKISQRRDWECPSLKRIRTSQVNYIYLVGLILTGSWTGLT